MKAKITSFVMSAETEKQIKEVCEELNLGKRARSQVIANAVARLHAEIFGEDLI